MQAVILAGGKGTRLKELTAEVPKPMIPVAGKPILLHQINNLKECGVKDFILVVGYLGQKIIDYFGDGSKFDVNIEYYHEAELLGTGGALYYIKDKLEDDFFLLYGDIFLNVDFARMMKFHKKNKSDATLFVHPNSHPYDSALVVEKDSLVVGWDHKNLDRKHDYKNLVNSGIYVLTKRIIVGLDGTKKDLETDILIPQIDSANIFSYRSTEYAKDMGTPDRLIKVNQDYENGLPMRKNLSNKQKCIFLDRDGTVNIHNDYINHPDQIILLSNVAEAIKLINDSEYICIITTNQPVIARGECSFEMMANIHKRLETILGKEGAYIDDIIFCPHHPHSGYEGEVFELKIDCDCRKPNTRMFIAARDKFNIDFSQSYIIGDSTVDIEAGKRAGLRTILVKTGVAGSDEKYQVEPDAVAEDLLEAVKKIIVNKEV
jgi:histidinol-phosphate phosphatase family protein